LQQQKNEAVKICYIDLTWVYCTVCG